MKYASLRLRPALMTIFALLLVMQLVGSVFSPAVANAAASVVYYVSQSGGDDAADGLSETTAWKTLAQVSGKTFQPGDRILLKSGDRWTGETLTLRGSGTPEQPIELSSYGTGDKPLISPQLTDASAITLHNEEGWRIDGIAMEKAMMGINAEFDGVYDKRSLAFENLDIRDMDDTFNSKPNLYNHFSTGIALKGNGNASTYHLRGLTLKSIAFDNVNTPLFQGAISQYTNTAGFGTNARFKDVTIDGLTATNAKQWGFNFLFMVDAVITNISAENVGVLDSTHDGVNPYGIGGVVVANSKNVVFDGVELRNIGKGSQGYDGVGFDFEGGTDASNVTLRNAVIDGIDGAGIMIFDNGGVGGTEGAHVDGATVRNFGRSPGNSSGGIKFFPNNKTTGTIRNVTIDRGDAQVPFLEGTADGFALTNMTYLPEALQAEFVELDTATSGDWRSRFGREGYKLEKFESKLPDYAVLNETSGASAVAWQASTSDRRALTNAQGTARSAGAMVSADKGGTLVYDLDMKDGLTHRIAFYMADWNREGLKQSVTVEDEAGHILIEPREIKDFGDGVYFVFDAAGHVVVKVTGSADSKAVVGGIFFGNAKATPVLTLSKAAAKPSIDGDITDVEWQSAESVEMSDDAQVLHGEGSLIGATETDLTGSVRLMWDAYGLYLAGTVQDNEYFNPYGQGDPLNNNDVIQLTVDPMNRKTSGTGDAYIFDFVPTSGSDHSGPAAWYEHWKWGGADYRAGVKVAGKITADGYALEAFVPWSALRKNGESFTPGPNMKLGLGVMIGDFRANGQLKGILTNFGQGENTIGDAASYRTVLLTERATASAAVSRGKPVTATSNNAPSSDPAMAVDGDEATAWVAANGDLPQSLQVDLGRSYRLNKIELLYLTNDPWKYSLEGSNDGSDWTMLADRSSNTVQGPAFADDVTGSYRYVRVNMIAGWGNWATMKEFKVYTDESLLASAAYAIDDSAHTIAGVRSGESVDTFLSQLAAVNSTIGLFRADGTTPVSGGTIEDGMKVVLQSTKGQQPVVYTVKSEPPFTISSSFKVGSSEHPEGLAPGELLTGMLQVTNNGAAAQTVTLVTALFDASGEDGAMVNFSYQTQTLGAGETSTLTAGFKLPNAVAGYKAKLFVVSGSSFLAPSGILSEPAVLAGR
ncbi:discoidin domain-containing protein [Cohnella sp. GCM10020058]|uniref:discoidin domain-containing protein n=1 Tax=Cohnella sp. GCM10020058 TaxID=3317330 RepID=UPI003632A16A